jgi:Tol biopolymer transport system component
MNGRGFRGGIAALVGAAVLAVAGSPASATFPGKNGRIFFNAPTNKGVLSIFSMRADGSGVQRLPNPTGHPMVEPSVSPQGEIAFSTIGNKHYDIYVMNVDGTDLRQLTHDGGSNQSPSFCGPSGGRLVWKDSVGRIQAINRNGTHKRMLVHRSPGVAAPACSPNGQKVVFTDRRSGRDDIFKVNPNRRVVRLTRSPKNGFATNADFSPNGKNIVFDAGEGVSGTKTGIFTMKLDKTHQLRLTPKSRFAYDPAYSPNGKRIVFAGGKDADKLFVMRRDGSHIHQVHGAGLGPAPDWAVRLP